MGAAMLELDDFATEQLLNRIDYFFEGIWETVYWREVVEPGEGYILVWHDGQHHHTYHYPPDISWELDLTDL